MFIPEILRKHDDDDDDDSTIFVDIRFFQDGWMGEQKKQFFMSWVFGILQLTKSNGSGLTFTTASVVTTLAAFAACGKGRREKKTHTSPSCGLLVFFVASIRTGGRNQAKRLVLTVPGGPDFSQPSSKMNSSDGYHRILKAGVSGGLPNLTLLSVP